MQVLPISVLIPTMNRPQSLIRTLDGYLNAQFIPSQIVIVDQSEGELREQVKAAVFERRGLTEIEYIYQQTPSSTIARNTAFQHAHEEVIVYSDDDIDVYEHTLAALFDIFKDDRIAMVAALNDFSPGERSKIGYLLGTKSYKNRFIGHVTKSVLGRFPINFSGQTDTMWAMGFFFAVRRSLAIKYGLQWDENLIGYAYAEDLDYSMSYYEHAVKDGFRCIFDERIHVGHLGSLEYRVPSRKSIYSYCVNRWYLSYKHKMGPISRLAICWCDFWKLMLRIAQKDEPFVFLKAFIYAIRNKKALSMGIVKYPF